MIKDHNKELINSFNSSGNLISIYFESNPTVNQFYNHNIYQLNFYRIREECIDNNTIYIGTEKEVRKYFQIHYNDFRKRIERLSEEKSEKEKNLSEINKKFSDIK